MRIQTQLLLVMISLSTTSYAASTAGVLTEQPSSAEVKLTCAQEIKRRYESEVKLRDIIMPELFKDTHALRAAPLSPNRAVGIKCSFSKATELFLLTAGEIILERKTGNYLGLGSGVGYFEELLGILCPEFADWHTVLTDSSVETVQMIKNAKETFALDVTKLEESMLIGRLQGQTFDIISIQNVFHFLSENERIKCLKSLSALLNPNGVILLSYEQSCCQRFPLEFPRSDPASSQKLQPGVYAFKYDAKNDSVTLELGSEDKTLIPLNELLSAKPTTRQQLASQLRPDDISVHDAIVIDGHDPVNVLLYRGEYTEDMRENSEIFEFAIVFRDINFRMFQEMEVQYTLQGFRYNSLSETLMSNILTKEKAKLGDIGSFIRVLTIQRLREKLFDAVGICHVLKKRSA